MIQMINDRFTNGEQNYNDYIKIRKKLGPELLNPRSIEFCVACNIFINVNFLISASVCRIHLTITNTVSVTGVENLI